MSRCQWCGSLTDSAGCLNITCSANQVVRDEVATLRAEVARLRAAIRWALGYGAFRDRLPGEGAFWWRRELRERSGYVEPVSEFQP